MPLRLAKTALTTEVIVFWVSHSRATLIENLIVRMNASTDPADIQFGQSYTLPSNWTDGTVNSDPRAPRSGFRFINNTSAASAIVYKRINGQQTPIYFSVDGPLPKGTEDMTPVKKVSVWFSKEAESATMISDFQGQVREVDMTGSTDVTLEYDASGNWNQM